MGKPVRGRNQFPFAIGGLLVNGASIDGRYFDKQLYIHKQRSYGVYDLIDMNGTIYEYMHITYQDKNGKVLDYYDIDQNLVLQIKNNSFYIKAQDVPRNIYGFVTLYMYRYLKVHTGDVIYRTTQDASLSGVRLNPNMLTVGVGSNFNATATFIPHNYPLKSGKWMCDNDNVSIQAVGNNVIITGKKIGLSTVSFIPDANDTHIAHTIVNVIENALPLTKIEVRLRDSDPYVYEHLFDRGEEFTLTVVPFPYTQNVPGTIIPKIPEDAEPYFEYIGSDGKLDHKFKVKNWDPALGNSHWASIGMSLDDNGNMFNVDFYVSAYSKPIPDSAPYLTPENIRMNVNETYKIGILNSKYYQYPGTVYFSTNPSVATVDENGNITAVSEGTATIKSTFNGMESKGSLVTVKTNYVDRIYIEPAEFNTFELNVPQKLYATVNGNSTPIAGVFKSDGPDSPNINIQPDGVLTATYYGNNWGENEIRLRFEPTDYILRTFGRGTKYFSINSPRNQFTGLRFYDEMYLVELSQMIEISPAPDSNSLFMPYWGFDAIIEDTNILELAPYDDEYDNKSERAIRFKGIGKGTTNIKFVYKHNPTISATIPVVVY